MLLSPCVHSPRVSEVVDAAVTIIKITGVILGKNETRSREGRKEEKSIMQSCKLCGEKIKLIGSYAFALYSGVSSGRAFGLYSSNCYVQFCMSLDTVEPLLG